MTRTLAPGGTLTKSAARCYPSPATNDKAPAYSWLSGPGLLYALRGLLAASVRRFAVWEYRDSHKGIKRRSGPVNGLYCGFVFWPFPCPAGNGRKMPHAGHRRAHKRREDGGGYRDMGGALPASEGHKNRPRIDQGRKLRYSRFFRRLPDHHQGKGKNKQDNQAGVTSSLLSWKRGGSSSGQSYCT